MAMGGEWAQKDVRHANPPPLTCSATRCCVALQRTRGKRNGLKHTVTQHTAAPYTTHRNARQSSATQGNKLEHTVAHHNTLQHTDLRLPLGDQRRQVEHVDLLLERVVGGVAAAQGVRGVPREHPQGALGNGEADAPDI